MCSQPYPGFAALKILDWLKVAAATRAQTDARLVIVQRGQRFVLQEW